MRLRIISKNHFVGILLISISMQLPSYKGIQNWECCTNLLYQYFIFMRDQVTSWVVRASISPLHREGTRQWSPLNTARRKVESNSMFSTVLRARKGFSSLLSFAPCSTDSSSTPSTISQLDCRAHKSMTMLWQEMSGVRARAGSRRQQLMWSSNSLIVFFPFSLSSLGLFQVSVTQERRHRLSFIHKKLAVKHKRALNSSSPNGIPLSFDEIITLLKKNNPTNQPTLPAQKRSVTSWKLPWESWYQFHLVIRRLCQQFHTNCSCFFSRQVCVPSHQQQMVPVMCPHT